MIIISSTNLRNPYTFKSDGKFDLIPISYDICFCSFYFYEIILWSQIWSNTFCMPFWMKGFWFQIGGWGWTSIISIGKHVLKGMFALFNLFKFSVKNFLLLCLDQKLLRKIVTSLFHSHCGLQICVSTESTIKRPWLIDDWCQSRILAKRKC